MGHAASLERIFPPDLARYLARRAQYKVALNKIGDRYLSAVAEVIERGRKQGVIHADDVPAAVHAIHMLCAGWAMGGHSLGRTDKESYWREISRIVEGRFLAPRLEALEHKRDASRWES